MTLSDLSRENRLSCIQWAVEAAHPDESVTFLAIASTWLEIEKAAALDASAWRAAARPGTSAPVGAAQ